MSFRRIWNYLLMIKGFYLSLLFRKVIVWGQPFALSAELVRGCNLHCPGCVGGTLHGEDVKQMSPELLEKTLISVYKRTFYLQLWFQGEPLLYNELTKALQLSRKYRMFSVLATNGLLLNESINQQLIVGKLEKIIVTIDTLPSSESGYRVGGNEASVVAHIKQLVQQKKLSKSKLPCIEAQMIVTSENENQIDEFKRILKEAGVDHVRLKPAHFNRLDDPDLPVPSKHARYKKHPTGIWEPIQPIRNRCRRLWSTLIISHKGQVVPCCFDKGIMYPLGNADIENPVKIWKAEAFNKYRKAILKNRRQIDICRNCTE